MFEIPEFPVHQYYHYRYVDERICGPSQDELLERLASSLETWRELGWTRYTFRMGSSSFSGSTMSTVLTVEDSVVVQRAFEGMSVGGSVESWVETSGSIGSHEWGHAPQTLDEHYQLCAERISSTDPRVDLVTLRFDARGVLEFCLVTPTRCQDDCSSGSSIYDLKPLGRDVGEAAFVEGESS